MDERCGVDDFNYGAKANAALLIVRKKLGCQQQQSWPDALTAARTQVLADIGDGAHSGDGVTPELALNGGKVIAEQLKNFFRGYGR